MTAGENNKWQRMRKMYSASPTEDWSGLQEKQYTPVFLQMCLHQGEIYKQEGEIQLTESYAEERQEEQEEETDLKNTDDRLID